MVAPHNYQWPDQSWSPAREWHAAPDHAAFVRDLPESPTALASDSRWPAFFPVSLSIATTCYNGQSAMERISGASIVNRFPYIMAISVCRDELSPRHHGRHHFITLLERSGHCALQFLPAGSARDSILTVISHIPEGSTKLRVAATKLGTREAITGPSPVFADAYLVYEGRLAEPSHDFDGGEIFPAPWIDVGSHRLYFLEVTAIQLRSDIASGERRIHWRSLPTWESADERSVPTTYRATTPIARSTGYVKGYTPHYEFPADNTVAFEATDSAQGMSIRTMPKHAVDQIEINDDRARWPCFFPSSVGMITTWYDASTPNVMPCGSTTVISRSPFTIAPCVSYARINQRYAPRATLNTIRRTGRFGCSVPFLRDDIVNAIRLSGTCSIREQPDKVASCGLEVQSGGPTPVLPALPIHFECEVTGEVRLGTHVMFLGEARQIRIRHDLCAANPISWNPWAEVRSRGVNAHPVTNEVVAIP